MESLARQRLLEKGKDKFVTKRKKLSANIFFISNHKNSVVHQVYISWAILLQVSYVISETTAWCTFKDLQVIWIGQVTSLKCSELNKSAQKPSRCLASLWYYLQHINDYAYKLDSHAYPESVPRKYSAYDKFNFSSDGRLYKVGMIHRYTVNLSTRQILIQRVKTQRLRYFK